MLTTVSMSALMACAGISSGPAASPLLRVMMAFLIFAFEGLSQLRGSSVSAGGMSGGESEVGRFSNSLKSSAYRFSCSLVLVSGFPFLSFTGLSAEISPTASWSPGTGPSDSPVRLLSLLVQLGHRCSPSYPS